jgi:hypothetical protein
MPSTSQVNKHQIIFLSNRYGIFITGSRRKKIGKWQNSRVVCLCRILLEASIAAAIQMYISIHGLLTREISDKIGLLAEKIAHHCICHNASVH